MWKCTILQPHFSSNVFWHWAGVSSCLQKGNQLYHFSIISCYLQVYYWNTSTNKTSWVAPDGGAETRVHQHDASNSEVLMVNALPTTTNLDMVLSSVHPCHQSSYPPLTNMQTYAGLGMFLDFCDVLWSLSKFASTRWYIWAPPSWAVQVILIWCFWYIWINADLTTSIHSFRICKVSRAPVCFLIELAATCGISISGHFQWCAAQEVVGSGRDSIWGRMWTVQAAALRRWFFWGVPHSFNSRRTRHRLQVISRPWVGNKYPINCVSWPSKSCQPPWKVSQRQRHSTRLVHGTCNVVDILWSTFRRTISLKKLIWQKCSVLSRQKTVHPFICRSSVYMKGCHVACTLDQTPSSFSTLVMQIRTSANWRSACPLNKRDSNFVHFVIAGRNSRNYGPDWQTRCWKIHNHSMKIP